MSSNNQNLNAGLTNKSYSMLCNILRYVMASYPSEIFHLTNDICQYTTVHSKNNNLNNTIEPAELSNLTQKKCNYNNLFSYYLCDSIPLLMKHFQSLVQQKSNILQSFLNFRQDLTISLVKVNMNFI